MGMTHPPMQAKQVILKALPFFRIAAGPDAPLRPWRRAMAPMSPGAPSSEGAIEDDGKLLGSCVAQNSCLLSQICGIVESSAALICSRKHTGQWGQPRVYTQPPMKFSMRCLKLVIYLATPALSQAKEITQLPFSYSMMLLASRSLVV